MSANTKSINDGSTIQEELKRLEAIVAWFEQDDLDIEAAIAKLEEGSKVAETLKQRLETMENRITVLKERFGEVK